MQAIFVAALLLLAGQTALAGEIKAPKISIADVDWDSVRAALNGNEASRRLSASAHVARKATDPLARLNQLTEAEFPSITASSVPVLLPFDLAAFLRKKSGEDVDYLAGFGPPTFFLAGPAGYNAAYSVPLYAGDKRREVAIDVSAFALLYDLDPRVGGEEKPPMGLQADFPNFRRFYFESHMRYLFTRHGVLYAVSVECYDSSIHSGRKLSCQDAHGPVTRLLTAMTLAGGTPQPITVPETQPEKIRPQEAPNAFSFYPPGQLISGTGVRRRGGDPDYTAYATIRFPLAGGPVQTYSQVFINLGDCTAEPGDSRTVRRNGAPFRCLPGKSLAAAEMPTGGQNMFPWRDNFCEMRSYFVGQCPSGIGHQGQDIVPVSCALSPADGEACDRSHHRVVAVHDGMVMRAPKQEGLVIVANAPGTHLRFRYLHMNPKVIDEGGFFSGRPVIQGQIIGKVGNYSGREGGTSYHLHFDMQAPTKDGWVLVNPYMTLVSAYERMMGSRGTEMPDDPAETSTAESSDTAAVPPEYRPARKNLRKSPRSKK